MFLRIKTESLNEDCVCFRHWHLVNVLQVSFHAPKVRKLLIAECTRLFCVVSPPPLFVHFSHVSFHFLFRLKCFATGLTIRGFLSMWFHVAVQMVRIGVAFSALVAYVNLVTRVVRSFLVVIKCFCVFEHEFANITLDVLVFGIVRRKMEVQFCFFKERPSTLWADVFLLLHMDPCHMRFQVLGCRINFVAYCTFWAIFGMAMFELDMIS